MARPRLGYPSAASHSLPNDTSAAMTAFRGRILDTRAGYEPRSLLELHLRAGIGSILNKPEWWKKWNRDNGSIRARWLRELEVTVVQQTLHWMSKHWEVYDVYLCIRRKFDGFPVTGTDEEKRAFVNSRCRMVEYNMIWNLGGCSWGRFPDESSDEFVEGNARMESYSQVLWFCELLRLNRQMREMIWIVPHGLELGTTEGLEMARRLLHGARSGELTLSTFAAWCPDIDLPTHILEGLWLHIDRVMAELDAICYCVTNTLESVIEEHALDTMTGKGFLSDGPVPETWIHDAFVPDDLKRTFAAQVATLSNIPDEEKDWHPDSDEQVLDLVHPSLYCCVQGRTRRVPQSNSPTTGDSIINIMQRMAFTGTEVMSVLMMSRYENFQWIPTDIDIDVEGHATIQSYINNLHPGKHAAMYDSIARIFERFVPLFDRVLSCLAFEQAPPRLIEIPDMFDRDTQLNPLRPTVPEILPLQPVNTTPFSLKSKRAQVIVKIAEIHLTPEKPSFPGGSWHIEGSETEHLVATGIYYFGCENITESKLSFRVIVSEPDYKQSDDTGVAAMYGLENDARLVQHFGSVTAIEDRAVVFPNTLQHKVEPFELLDPTRPGVRKILAFFLVDPATEIPSSSVIPPQQQDWLQDLQHSVLKVFEHLPDAVVQQNLMDLLGVGMSLDEAKAHRLELMEDRRVGGDEEDDYELNFSLCEH